MPTSDEPRGRFHPSHSDPEEMWGEGEFQLGEERAWEMLAGENPARQEEDGNEDWNAILEDITKKSGHFNF